MPIAEHTDVEATFKSLPWKILTPAKAEQVARAIEVVFQTQAVAFHGGDAYYIMAAPSHDLEAPRADERMKMLLWLLERLNVTPGESHLMQELGFEGDNEEEVAEEIQDRFEHILNLAHRMDDLDSKIEALFERDDNLIPAAPQPALV